MSRKQYHSCVLVGSGFGSLALGALLAKAGVQVTILEQSSLVGGHGRTINLGEFHFSAGPRYLWGFGNEEPGQELLRRCGLSDVVHLCRLDEDGFERVYTADCHPFSVPMGLARFAESLKEKYPDQRCEIDEFFRLLKIADDFIRFVIGRGVLLDAFPKSAFRYCVSRWERLFSSWRFASMCRWTLNDAFNAARIKPEVRNVLYAHGMIFALAATEISFLAFAGGTCSFHRGAYYPMGGFAKLCDALCQVITAHHGRIVTNAQVDAVLLRGNRHIDSVRVSKGEQYAADVFVGNIDPRSFMNLVGLGSPRRERVFNYPWSNTLSSVFLGLKDDAVTESCFGRWNIWHLPSTIGDPNPYREAAFQKPSYLYINSPSAVVGSLGQCPPGKATLTAFAPACYRSHRALMDGNPADYQQQKQLHLSDIIRTIEEDYAPGLQDSVEVALYHTPLDIAASLHAPQGNAYGIRLCPEGIRRKPAACCEFSNLYFLSAYTTLPGIASLAQGALILSDRLCSDKHVTEL